MAISANHHPAYAMAARREYGLLYALVFALCMAVMVLAFMYFLRHGYFLIHIPTINFKLPDLHLTSP
ncbi:MAG TPA: hypothetical protein VFS62_12560 [Chloroflexota bacterium]|jgi:hypothetical protein|nr:hypothetical protein [Chloroflexota bacterium]